MALNGAFCPRGALARRFTDDQLSEKLLSMVEHGSRMFALEAKKELDAVEGVPGTPGVRQFQLAAPAAGGPRPRDLGSPSSSSVEESLMCEQRKVNDCLSRALRAAC